MYVNKNVWTLLEALFSAATRMSNRKCHNKIKIKITYKRYKEMCVYPLLHSSYFQLWSICYLKAALSV